MTQRAESKIGDRARRSKLLSLLAAGVTAGIFVAASIANSTELSFLIWITFPPVVFSVAAAVQYRRTSQRGAGASAAVVYWLFIGVFYLQGGLVFVPGALLQTAACWVSRPSRVNADVATDSRIA